MSEATLSLLGTAGVVVGLVALWCLLSLLSSVASGWWRLSRRYRAPGKPSGERYSWFCTRVGFIVYSGLFTGTVAPGGLFLSAPVAFRPAHAPLLLPWEVIRVAYEYWTPWGRRVLIEVGQPAVARLAVSRRLVDAFPIVVGRAPAVRAETRSS